MAEFIAFFFFQTAIVHTKILEMQSSKPQQTWQRQCRLHEMQTLQVTAQAPRSFSDQYVLTVVTFSWVDQSNLMGDLVVLWQTNAAYSEARGRVCRPADSAAEDSLSSN